MITTNKTQPKFEEGEPKKLKILTTDKVKLKEFNFTPREIPGVIKRQTRKVEGGMLTTSDYEDRLKQTPEAKAARLAKIKEAKAAKRGRPKAKK